MDASSADSGSPVTIAPAALQPLIVKLLQRKGMFVAEAEIVAARMLEADLCGRQGGGVVTLSDFLEAMDLGDIDPRARLITVCDVPAAAVLDGSTGMGHVAATRAMEMAIEKAQAAGVASVVVRNSRPCGDLVVIARLAAQHGLIAVVTTTALEANPGDTLAWTVPSPAGGIQTGHDPRGTPLESLVNVLSAGLAGAELPPRKQKAVPFANTVEYTLLAFQPDHFGCRESLSRWQGAAEPAPISDVISLSAELAEQLAGLARRIKFPVPWLPEEPAEPPAQ